MCTHFFTYSVREFNASIFIAYSDIVSIEGVKFCFWVDSCSWYLTSVPFLNVAEIQSMQAEMFFSTPLLVAGGGFSGVIIL